MTEDIKLPTNPLKCQYTEWNKRPVVSFPIDALWASVPIAITFQRRPFYDPVKLDIMQNGMHFPIIVVSTHFSELQKQKNIHKKNMNELPEGYMPEDNILVVWGGSNRIAIAKELNFTHIDCVVYENFQHAWRDQELQRSPYRHLYTGKRFR